MPIGIDAYKQIARSNISQLAIVQGQDGEENRIGKASDKGVGFLQRLFNTGASKKANIEIARDFKASMVAAYGQKIAEEALAGTIGAKGFSGAKLSSTLVQSAIAKADEYMAERLDLRRTGDAQVSLRIEGRRYDVNTTGLGESEKTALKEAKVQIETLNDLLMEMPTDTMALQDFSDRLHAAKDAARHLLENEYPQLTITADAQDAFAAASTALTKLLSLVDGKLQEATDVCDHSPVTYKALADFAGKYVESAVAALDSFANGGTEFGLSDAVKGELPRILTKLTRTGGLLETLGNAAKAGVDPFGPNATPEQKEAVRKVFPELEGVSETDVCPDPKVFVGKNFEKKIAEFCAAIVKQELAALSPSMADEFAADAFKTAVEQDTRKEFGALLNRGNWTPISKDVTFSLNEHGYKAKSVITPASHMGGAVGQLYNDGGPRGYNSHSYGEAKHAVNLANSRFEVDVGGTTKTVFSGIRHGVHAAVDVEGEAEFKAANLSRAKEAVIAAFTSRQDLVDAATHDPNTPVEFTFTSVSLLTPDFARDIFGGKHGNEKLMLRAQTEAYRALDGQVLEIDVPVTTTDASGTATTTMTKVKVKPQMMTFNYGVNWGGVGALSGMFGGWGPSGDVNGPSLAKLDQFASAESDRLQRKASMPGTNPAESAKLLAKSNAIDRLLDQIRQIDKSRSYASDGHEAYKMASRIAVLSYLCGGVPAWNCKSGKDRTGMMDVECKFLATLVALGRPIPEPGAPLGVEERMLYRNLLLQSGNHEMQQYNTGIAGYKLEDVGSITERIGDIDAQKVFLGGSKIVQG